LQGQKTGATVKIHASPSNVNEEVFQGVASGPDEVFTLTRPLKAGEKVYATQSVPGAAPGSSIQAEVVQPEPSQAELGPISPETHLHACGRCAAFGGLPGADVQIVSQTRGPMGKGTVDPDLGAARVVFAQPLLEGEVLTGQQSICSLLGPPSPLPPPDLPYSVQRVIAKPAIQEPLHACERAVLVKGVAVGATVRMFRNDIESGSSCFDYPELWFRVADPLKKDEKVGFDQRFPDCELTGPPVHAKVGSAAAVPVPVVSRHAERSSHRPALQRRRADSSDRAVI